MDNSASSGDATVLGRLSSCSVCVRKDSGFQACSCGSGWVVGVLAPRWEGGRCRSLPGLMGAARRSAHGEGPGGLRAPGGPNERRAGRRTDHPGPSRPGRIYADFILTLKADEPGTDDGFHRVFVVETKGVHLKASEDTEYKRSIVDICSDHARADWAEFVPAMRDKVVRIEVVDEDEWRERLNGMFRVSG